MIVADIYRRLKVATVGTWLLFVVPFLIFFALVLNIGPALQFFSSTALSNQAPSIYDAAFQNGQLIQFASLGRWLGLALNAQVLAVAAGVTIATVSAKTLRGAAIMTGLATFFFWTLNDVLSVLLGWYDLSLLTAISANFIGGFLLALIVFPILCLYNYAGKESLKTKSAKALFPILIISFGLIISAVAHTVLTFVYQPIPARVEAIFSAPASGSYVASLRGQGEPEGMQAANARQPFSLLPPNILAREAEVGSFEGHPRLSWRRTGTDRYNIEIAFFEGCVGDSEIAGLHMPAARFTQHDIAGLDLDFGEVPSEFFVLNAEGNRFSADAGRSALFAMEAGDGVRLTNLASFARSRANLQVDTVLPLSVYVTAPLTLRPRQALSQVSRTLAVGFGGTTHAIRFERAARAQGGPRTCRLVQAGSGPQLPSRVAIGDNQVGVLVRISRGAGDVPSNSGFAGRLVVAGANGWVSVSGIAYGQMDNPDLGAVDSILMSGNGTRLRVDGQNVELSRFNSVEVHGDLTASVGENGDRYISGSASGIWNGATRLNATRWERLAVELQIFAISSVAIVLAALARLLRSTFARLKRDEALYYYF